MAISPQLQKLLDEYGLGSLAEWASNAIVMGWSEEQVTLEMYKRQEFKDRFAGIFMLQANGHPPISVNEYLAYEKSAYAQATMWGMKLTKEDIDNAIGNNVSTLEMERRFDVAAASVFESDTNIRAEMQRFGIGLGDQMKYWMDPKKTLGELQQEYRTAVAAGTAITAGYGQITLDQARRLTEAGLTREQTLSGFGELVKNQELFTSLNIGEIGIDSDQQIALLTGDQSVKEMIEERARQRTAEFGGGGGFTIGEEGFSTGVAD